MREDEGNEKEGREGGGFILMLHARERLDYIELLLEPIFARLDECRAANLTQIAQVSSCRGAAVNNDASFRL